MSAKFTEVFRGTLTRETGLSDGFTCRLEVRLADFASLPDQDGVSVPITAGSVEWAYLGATTKVSGGSIDFFRRPLTAGDPNWKSLITTPNYPDHSSGANSFTGAVTRILALFFETDHLTFSVTTTNPGPTIVDTRTYNRFSDAAQDVVDARIYEGIHFRFADEVGRRQGRQVANWVFKNFLRPLHRHDDDERDQHH